MKARQTVWLGLALAGFFLSQTGLADHKGFVTLKNGRDIFVDYKSASPGHPTIVLLNGLTYQTTSWKAVARDLEKTDLGLLRYDMRGQGKTVARNGPVTGRIDFQDQVEDASLLLEKLGITAPVDLVGLSYGGGVALAFAANHPEKIANLYLMAPYTEPVAFQDRWIRQQISYTKVANPWLTMSDEELYDYYLRILIYNTYPLAEPSITKHPYRLEGVYRMVQGIRKLPVGSLTPQLPRDRVHLIVAGKDQYISRRVMDEFWQSLPEGVGASRLIIEGSMHKIPETAPHFARAWIELVARGDSRIGGGRTYQGDPRRGTAHSGGETIQLPVDAP